MSKTSYEQYAKDIQNLVRQLPRQLTREQEKQIGKIYLKAFKDIEKKLEKCTDNKYRERLLKAYQTQIYDELYPLIERGIIEVTDNILNIQKESMIQLLEETFENQSKLVDGKHKLQAIVDITNRRLVHQMVKGKIYYNGRGLDEMLWDATKCAEDRLNLAITSCIAQGMGAAEMSQNLKEFAMGGHHTWSRNKIREKLGDGYARKYGSGGLDYEALRLARTTLTHQAQISVINSSKVNPYLQFVKWHSDHQAGRTCQQCIDRDGQLFKIDEVPLDHPNGMCWIQPVYSIDGKTEATPEEIAKDMKAWGKGEPNSGLMDKIYKRS